MSQYDKAKHKGSTHQIFDLVEEEITPRSIPGARLRLEKHVPLKEHRSGWAYCVDQLEELHNSEGIFVDDFVEQRFSWDFQQAVDCGLIPYTEPWVGFMHNPPNMPIWFEYCSSPQIILGRALFQRSLALCKGLFVFSDHHKQWLEQAVDVPVHKLAHPTDLSAPCFSMDQYISNPRKKIIQIGYWLRRLHSMRHLPVDGLMKLWIVTNSFALECRDREARTMDVYADNGDDCIGLYEEWQWVDHGVYDRLLSRNIVFLHLYDASANNALLECIARNTPVLVNPLPAVVEYLGEEYPLYFEDLGQAAIKAENMELIADAHAYLSNMDKQVFSAAAFKNSIVSSPIYQALPATSEGSDLTRDSRMKKISGSSA